MGFESAAFRVSIEAQPDSTAQGQHVSPSSSTVSLRTGEILNSHKTRGEAKRPQNACFSCGVGVTSSVLISSCAERGQLCFHASTGLRPVSEGQLPSGYRQGARNMKRLTAQRWKARGHSTREQRGRGRGGDRVARGKERAWVLVAWNTGS